MTATFARWLLYLIPLALPAASLEALPEHLRPDPFGGIVTADGPGRFERQISLEAARGGYVSCHLTVKLPEGGAYTLRLEPVLPAPGIEAELFREWFHFVPEKKAHYPDALIPARLPYSSRIPEPGNQIKGQTAQAFWLDIWIASSASPGDYELAAVLEAGGQSTRLPVRVRVLSARIPAEDAVVMDHNSYDASWLANQYPSVAQRAGSAFESSDAYFELIHALHRTFYEHRGVFHQLGYGHAGRVSPEFAPVREGSGRKLRIADWALYDRHYGPLFDGSAFAGTRRGPHPIPFVYLPVNPEWPASFLNWGEAAYEAEFVGAVSQMERHFREKGWVNTRFELFFNHKKRYMGFNWDGDESRFPEDFRYFREYARLLRLAVPSDSPVRFVFRADVSWMMEEQFKALAGVINFWVCGGTEFAWFAGAPKLLHDRGDIVWIYGGTPQITEVSSSMTVDALRAWMLDVDGFVRWLTTSPGKDPWFQSDGGGTALLYPGDRFGVGAPLASIRLKIQRNGLQDLALAASFAAYKPDVKAEVARRFNGSAPADWRTPRPALADRPPMDWNNADIDDVPSPIRKSLEKLNAGAWQNVRAYVLDLARRQP